MENRRRDAAIPLAIGDGRGLFRRRPTANGQRKLFSKQQQKRSFPQPPAPTPCPYPLPLPPSPTPFFLGLSVNRGAAWWFNQRRINRTPLGVHLTMGSWNWISRFTGFFFSLSFRFFLVFVFISLTKRNRVFIASAEMGRTRVLLVRLSFCF